MPLPFELRADPARIVAEARYTVHAEIRNAGGRRLFETSPAMPVRGGPGWTGGPVEILLVAAAPPDEVPTGVRYRLIGFVQSGRGVALLAAEALTLAFGADASYSGQAGCNSFGGSYGSGTGVATLGEARSTMMACPEPSAAAAYLGALGGARVEAVRGATLTLVSPAGDRLTFERE